MFKAEAFSAGQLAVATRAQALLAAVLGLGKAVVKLLLAERQVGWGPQYRGIWLLRTQLALERGAGGRGAGGGDAWRQGGGHPRDVAHARLASPPRCACCAPLSPAGRG